MKASKYILMSLSLSAAGPIAAQSSADAEMTAMFDADQRARDDPAKIDWSVLRADDAKRRARTKVLLDTGRLKSADDFYHAAFVFQHGYTPADYLLAHNLAVLAVAQGHPKANWIAAATLDRYLQAIGQPQIFGTQFTTPPGKRTTQEPYDRALLSDRLRAQFGVPDRAEQDKQRAQWEAMVRAAERR